MTEYSILSKYYDLLTKNVDYSAYTGYICRVLNKYNIKGTVLDAGCGTGEILKSLSKLGYDLIGVDKCAEMLAMASLKQTGALLLQQQLTELDLYGSISAAISTLDVINHLPNLDAVKRFFSRISLFMEDGGVFIFDINTPYKHYSVLGNNSFAIEFSEGMLVWRNHITDSGVLMELDLFIVDCGNKYIRETGIIKEYTYELADIINLLNNNFNIIEIVDIDGFTGITENSERAVILARRKRRESSG